MKSFKMNMVTFAMTLAASTAVSPVMAANFGVNLANTTKVNTDQFTCQRCTNNNGYQGQLGAHIGINDVDDIHAGNTLGSATDGVITAVSSDVQYQDESGYQANIQAHQLGLDNGFAHLSAGRSNAHMIHFDYSAIKTYQAQAQSHLWHNNGVLTPADTTNQFDLALQREKIGLGFDYTHDLYNAFVSYSQESKTGFKSSSITAPTPINIGAPVDAKTKQFDAGVNMSGDNWMAQLSYLGSFYENDANDLSYNSAPVQAATPDNQAHRVSLSGQYQLNRTIMSGRFITGRMIQDDNLIQINGNPLQNWDGQIDTLDGRIAVSSMLTNRLRLAGSIDYSKRDNQSSTAEFLQYDFNGLNGAFKENTTQDITRHTYKVNGSYRIASGYRVQAGFDRKEVERTYSDREQTHDDSLWMKFNVRAFDGFNINLKAEHANRSGSEYQANQYTSSENNPLLRKYYLADRSRNGVELRLNHTPNAWVSVDLTTRYAKDDYSKTEIGLTESEDYGYDMNVNLAMSKHVNGYVFAGQQWINSNQAGSQSYTSADWQADIEDEFINLGTGVSYSGLMQDQLTVGLDYLFSNSISDTLTTATGDSNSFGDDYSYTHSATAYANYDVSQDMAVKLTYRYERYFDTDAAQVGVNDIPGMITLGDINHDYNAHQVMLSFTYKLR
ncbi:MtrB/PioB family decaheme-associated outer membrane protein [Shewanella intestini]|uniref:MtrB/PioB family decaheme-associated outer membrane protein n=1 Tax=Shewanella intestini TaxID=2017544 RepID=A0ABS5I6G7_9GAMM|nr:MULTISPECIES: MtrB/PioB family decaheme-associated outer membrane protein [Shewanella]MBR9729619.1 MtrB/PioB family decaheme-associated outer membrane protein [Shewanella intestini]MRG37689.1 MtrB/PioB family decaheme-associated outer membrane protein [Shewanella sp. XMDDZSB0408]